MKVIQVCPLFYPYFGGVETHVHEVSKRLTSLGVDVEIYTVDPSGKLPKKQLIEGIEVSRFRSFSPKQIYFFSPKLFNALKNPKSADVIHVHAYPNYPALASVCAKIVNKKPLVFTPHYGGYFLPTEGASILRSILKNGYNFLAGKFMFDKANAVIVLSKGEGELLHCKFGLKKEKVRYIPNGVDVKKFEHVKTNAETKTLLYVGRIEKYKGLDFLLNAFLKVQKLFPDSQLIFVGKGSYKKELISVVTSKGVERSVRFYQDVPEKKLLDLYLSSSVFVLLSQYEGLPIALMEAMACGLPVIATRVGGISEIVQSGKNGFLLDYPPDENILCEQISLLFNDENYSAKTGLEARNRILSKFSWDQVAKNICQLYKEILNAPQRPI